MNKGIEYKIIIDTSLIEKICDSYHDGYISEEELTSRKITVKPIEFENLVIYTIDIQPEEKVTKNKENEI